MEIYGKVQKKTRSGTIEEEYDTIKVIETCEQMTEFVKDVELGLISFEVVTTLNNFIRTSIDNFSKLPLCNELLEILSTSKKVCRTVIEFKGSKNLLLLALQWICEKTFCIKWWIQDRYSTLRSVKESDRETIEKSYETTQTDLRFFQKNTSELILVLLKISPYIKDATYKSYTMVEIAARYNLDWIVELLIQKGAASGNSWKYKPMPDLNEKPMYDNHQVPKSCREILFEFTTKYEMIDFIQENKIYFDIPSKCPEPLQWKPLIDAIKNDNINLVEALLECGYSVDEHEGKEHKPAISFAVEHKRYDMIKVMLKHGAKIPYRYGYGSSFVTDTRDLYSDEELRRLVNIVETYEAKK
jgi:hypothetical protein